MNKGLSSFLDCARWISALLVLLTHLNNRMFVRLSLVPVADRGIALYCWTFICGFAHQAVVVFFVLSGFLVGGKLLRSIEDRRPWKAKKYLIDRIARIYVVLLPVLAITAISDMSGSHLFASTDVYESIHASEDLARHLSFLTLLGNMANLQNILVGTFGTDGPLGTLANEFWYYMTAPLLLAPWLRPDRAKAVALFAAGLCLLIAISVKMPDHASGFALWCIGAVGAIIKKPWIRRPSLAVLAFAISTVAIRICVRSEYLDNYWVRFAVDLVIAMLLANVFVSLRSTNQFQWLGAKVHQYLAGFSYSLYAVHAPLIVFLCALMESKFGFGWGSLPIGWQSALGAFGVLIVVLGAALILSRLTEANTGAVRSWVGRRFVFGTRAHDPM